MDHTPRAPEHVLSRTLTAAWIGLSVAAAFLCGCAPTPPVAQQEPFTVRSPHGDRIDEYYWIRDDHPTRKRDDVMSYLRAEQAYTDAVMGRMRGLDSQLLAEIRGRIKEDDSTAPVYDRGWWYWQSFAPGAEYATWMRQRGSVGGPDAGAPEEVMLDVNALATGKDFFRLSAAVVSPDGTMLAWTQDTQGRRGHELLVKDLRTGATLPDRIEGTLEPIVWSADGKSVFYMRQDPVLLQSGPVCRHVLGTPASADTIVYNEPDNTLFTSISPSASREWLCIEIEGHDTTELRAVPLSQPDAAPQVIIPREAEVRSYADHLKGTWVIRTNRDARNFRIMTATDSAVANRLAWTELVPHRTNASIDGFALLDGGIALGERADANAQVRIIPWGGGAGRVIPVEEAAYAMTLGDNRDPANTSVRVGLTTMVRPRTTIDVSLSDGTQVVRKVQPVIGYDASKYDTARVWVPSRDGKRIPVSIAWRKDAWSRDGLHPMLIEAYGAYGYPSNASFDLAGVSLMDRGFALATAHVRGGADLGQDWYEDGRKLNKINTFNDFIDVADALAADGWCDPARRFASGGSAGGLLMGAVANMGGDRFRGIVLGVPFVDALTTMLDPSIPLTTNEWSQWGNPIESREAYEYILSYSPYDNIAAKDYPAMMVTTGLWDSQVGYFEPAKYVARMRRLRTDSNPLVLDINLDAGHGGKSGRFERLRQVAREQAFIVDLARQ
jgi:oligopeptidase B